MVQKQITSGEIFSFEFRAQNKFFPEIKHGFEKKVVILRNI